MTGRVLAIARCREKRGPMELMEAAEVDVDAGIAGDPRGRKTGRQVTVLAREAWDAACADLGRTLPWTTRRANVLIEGLDLARTRHRQLRIGPTEYRIAMQTQPCFLMDRFEAGLKEALRPDWRGGVCLEVARGGRIAVGDGVELLP